MRRHFIVFWLLLVAAGKAASQCSPESAISLQVLGSGGPEMTDRRASSGYLVWHRGRAVILVDAGAGTALNFERSGADIADLKGVLFTHFHVDHSVDFPSLVKASYFSNRETDLPVFGPAGNELMPSASQYAARMIGAAGAYRYLKEYLEVDTSPDYRIGVTDVPLAPHKVRHYQLDDITRVSAIPVHHGPVAALAWRVDVEGCSISFSGDMSNRFDTLAGLARDSDMLVAHNAIPQHATGTARALHMPPSEIGKIASRAGVGQLILSHRMGRTLGREQQTRAEIARYFTGPVTFADDLDRFGLDRAQRDPSAAH